MSDYQVADPELLRRLELAGYEKVAPTYSAATKTASRGGRTTLLDLGELAAGQRVLDVCCGPGWLSLEAAPLVLPGGHVLGVDLSPAMRDQAHDNAISAGTTNIEFRVMDAEQLKLPDASFDRVFCSLGLMHVPDPNRAAAEMARVLRPGGRFVGVVWGSADATFVGMFAAALRAADEPLVVDYDYACRLGDPSVLSNILSTSGFVGVEVREAGGSMPVPDPGTYFDNFRSIGGLFSLLVDGLSDTGRARARAAFVAAAQPYLQADRFQLPARQLIATGRR